MAAEEALEPGAGGCSEPCGFAAFIVRPAPGRAVGPGSLAGSARSVHLGGGPHRGRFLPGAGNMGHVRRWLSSEAGSRVPCRLFWVAGSSVYPCEPQRAGLCSIQEAKEGSTARPYGHLLPAPSQESVDFLFVPVIMGW